MKIYTKTGDGGSTGLYGGRRVPKDDLRVTTCGEFDELNACLGMAAVLLNDSDLDAIVKRLQADVFVLGSDLATPEADAMSPAVSRVPRVTAAMTARLESEIDRLSDEAGPLTSFILPGGSSAAAAVHHARSVCRRAERSLISLAREQPVNMPTLPFVNRLSDHLFELARVINRRSGIAETPWSGKLPRT